jgi:UDP-N-acetylmuramoyl-tripeptide--D-alanyl-D-alanine ligase
MSDLDTDILREALAAHLSGPLGPLPPAHGLTFHSQRVTPGIAFVALPGLHHHGHDFAADALARGAPFILSDRRHPQGVLVDDAAAALLTLGRYARKKLTGPVIGITGSAGKTTSKALLAAALDAPASPGNLNTPYALATILVGAALHHPQRPLVLELGVDTPGDMAQLTALVQPTDALLTLIAPAHLEALGDLATVALEKGALLRAASGQRFASAQAHRQLPPDLQAGVRVYRALEAEGWPTEADVGHHHSDADGDHLRLSVEGRDIDVALPGAGRAFAENALGALLLAHALGTELDVAAARLQRAALEPGRLARTRLGDLTLIDDTYNANPASLREALTLLGRAEAPRHAILGSMLELGDGSDRYHRELGDACAAAGLASLITVGGAARALGEAAAALGVAWVGHFEDVDALAATPYLPPTQGTLLVKGSRGIGLERLTNRWRQPKERA